MGLTVIAYFAASLDGYIAKRDGTIDWLNEANRSVPEGEDYGFKEFMESVDVLIMGRKTFEQVLTFGEWPYGEKPVVVLSRGPVSIPADLSGSVTKTSEAPMVLCARLADQGAKRIYVDGGATIQGFLSEGLLSEIIVTVVPVVLGGGISPFGELGAEINLVQLGAKVYDFGFVQISYEVRGHA